MPRLEVGDRFPNLRLESTAGEVQLRSRWQEGPMIVAFMRHFGCSFCREHLVNLSAAHPQIQDAGGRVVAIFQYQAQPTEDFCEGRDLPYECLGDPLRAAYAQVEIGRGTLRELAGVKVFKRARKAYRAGGGQGSAQGGLISLMPGNFVVGRDGRVELAHYADSAADNPEVSVLIDAVRAAA